MCKGTGEVDEEWVRREMTGHGKGQGTGHGGDRRGDS